MRALFLLLALGCAAIANAQVPPPAAATPDCPKAAAINARHMLGLWRAEFVAPHPGATLLIERHPRYSESFSGAINRNGDRSQLAGDVEDGEFTLEESADGIKIAATWIGDVVEGSCGKEIRGTWKSSAETAPERRFVLRKQ
jgi:hypothetical protein